MDDWSWQERYSQSAFLSVPCLFPTFELRLLGGNYITAAPTNARLKTEGLLYAAYMHPVFYLHNIIQYIQNGASSSSWIRKSIFTKKLKILFSIRFLKICFFQEVHCNNMWVLFALYIIIFTSVKFLILTELVNLHFLWTLGEPEYLWELSYCSIARPNEYEYICDISSKFTFISMIDFSS